MPSERLEVPDLFEWNSSVTKNVRNSDSVDVIPQKRKKQKRKTDGVGYVTKAEYTKVAEFNPSSPDYQELENVDQCEQLVMAFPQSSKSWILYMVYFLKQCEIEKARGVAERALQNIPFWDQDEKFNIFVALLNFENLYGTEESLKQAFNHALQCCDVKKVHIHLANLYIKFKKHEEAVQLLETMVQKFKDDKDIWIMFIDLYMKLGKSEEACNLMKRSFRVLDKTFHADVMEKVAYLECECGNWEKGKALFEDIILNYPKRKDILSVYISVLNKSGDTDRAAQLLPLLEKKKKTEDCSN